MTAAEIIIAACLGAAPSILSIGLGLGICGCYAKWRIFRFEHEGWLYKDLCMDQLSKQCVVIFTFCVISLTALGGFASGVYVQDTLNLIQYLQ